MKKTILIFFSFLILAACSNDSASNSQFDIVETAALDSSDPYIDMFSDFMKFNPEYIFREVNFDMSEDEVRKTERSYKTSSENSSEKENELFFEVDLSSDLLDFADIRYSFDEKGLYFINVESYITTEEKSKSMNHNLETYLTNSYGKADIAEDGFQEFAATHKGLKVQIAYKEVNLPPTATEKGSYGFYLFYSLAK